MWHELTGPWGYLAGNAAATATVPAGASVLQIVAHSTAGGTLTIFGGTAIPIVATTGLSLRFNHTLLQARNNVSLAGSQDLVFTGVDSYFVEYKQP